MEAADSVSVKAELQKKQMEGFNQEAYIDDFFSSLKITKCTSMSGKGD